MSHELFHRSKRVWKERERGGRAGGIEREIEAEGETERGNLHFNERLGIFYIFVKKGV